LSASFILSPLLPSFGTITFVTSEQAALFLLFTPGELTSCAAVCLSLANHDSVLRPYTLKAPEGSIESGSLDAHNLIGGVDRLSLKSFTRQSLPIIVGLLTSAAVCSNLTVLENRILAKVPS
jgi:hypothetical protein